MDSHRSKRPLNVRQDICFFATRLGHKQHSNAMAQYPSENLSTRDRRDLHTRYSRRYQTQRRRRKRKNQQNNTEESGPRPTSPDSTICVNYKFEFCINTDVPPPGPNLQYTTDPRNGFTYPIACVVPLSTYTYSREATTTWCRGTDECLA